MDEPIIEDTSCVVIGLKLWQGSPEDPRDTVKVWVMGSPLARPLAVYVPVKRGMELRIGQRIAITIGAFTSADE